MKDGDVVQIDYTLLVDGKPFDTNVESVAKDKGIAREGKRYRPLTVTLGQQQLLPKLEAAVKKAKKGDALSVDLAAADAYGERDPKKIQDVPMAQFKRQKVEPKVGMELNMQGQRGLVTRVAGGRVRVDLNHELAGKAVRYDITVRDVLTNDADKAQAVLAHLFPSDPPKADVTKDTITIELPDFVKFDRDWPMHKFRLVADLRAALGAREVRLVETYPKDIPGDATGEEE